MSSSYEDLIKAKTLLGLHEKATLSEIKFRYKNLMKQFHPDNFALDSDENKNATMMSAQINEAYKHILEYCKEFEFPFDEESIRQKSMTPEEWWHSRFGQR